MKKLLITIFSLLFVCQCFGQLTMSTAENLAEGAVVSGTVTDNNNGPVNIPFHFYRTQLSGNGLLQIITQVTNSSLTSAGDMWINIFFKDSTLWTRKQVYLNQNSTVTDTFLVTGAEQDEVYIAFQNSGVVYGGPFNYTTHYDMLYVQPNNENEPNDFHSQAQTIFPGDVINGHISYKSDGYYVDLNDYYELVIPENGQVDLEFSWLNVCINTGFIIPGPSVYLYGKDSVSTGLLDHYSSNYSSILNIASANNSPFGVMIYDTMHIYGKVADTVQISLYNYFSGWGIGYCGAYSMRYLMSDLAPSNETEPNNDLASAQVLSVGDTIHGLIAYSNGNFAVDLNDYYKLVKPAGDSLRIYISAVNKYKYDSLAVNPAVYAYDKNGNPLIVYSASGAASGSGQLIGNVWMQPVGVPISDTMTIRGIPTDSVYIRVYDPSYSFKYELMPLSPFTGIENVSDQNLFNVYPNPATDKITISLLNKSGEKVEVSLISFTGAKVATLFEGKLTAEENLIDLFKVPSGNYFVSVRSNGSESFKKLLIQNK